jgi:hypothetical protein
MVYVNQTRPYFVNQMGKTQSKSLAERHGSGTAGERHGMCESALRRLIEGGDVQLRSFLTSTLHYNCQHLIPAASPTGKGPWHPLNWQLAGPQRRCGLRTVLKPKAPGINCHRLVFYLDCLTLELCCPETSVTNYQSTLPHVPEERRAESYSLVKSYSVIGSSRRFIAFVHVGLSSGTRLQSTLLHCMLTIYPTTYA